MITIAVINQKGGVGKTTTVANLGAAVAAEGHDLLLLDMDPQSHLTLHFGIEPGTADGGMYEVLTADAAVRDTIVAAGEHLGIVPATIDLAAAEIELAGTVGREQVLRDKLAASKLPYRFAMIDCPPSLGLLTLNALAAADEVVIPLQPHFLALQGLGKLLETVALVQRRINPRLRVGGVILCMYESSTRLAAEVVADLQSFFAAAAGGDTPWSQTRIFETVVRRNVKLAECPGYGKTIFDYEPSSHGAHDYSMLAQEFLSFMLASPPPQAAPATAAQVVEVAQSQAEQAAEEAQPEPAPDAEHPEPRADVDAAAAEQTPQPQQHDKADAAPAAAEIPTAQ